MNHAAIRLVTRRELQKLIARGELDEPSRALIERALDKTAPRNHAPWVLALAEALGAERDLGLTAAACAEMCCVAIDLIDDIEDGDAKAYLAELTPSVLFNLGAHLLALAAAFAGRLATRVGPEGVAGDDDGFVARSFGLFSAMACGQRLDLTRDDWSLATYERMSQLNAGRQLELYFRMAALAARADPTPLLAVADPLAVLLQLRADTAAADPRITALAPDGVRAMRERCASALAAALQAVPEAARPVLQQLAEIAARPPEGKKA